MASTIYRRPDLFPFSFASIQDWSGDFAKFGTTADALNYLTNLLTFQVSVSWNVNWKRTSPGAPVYNSSVNSNINLPLFIPKDVGSINSSVISWYNSDTIGTKRVSPAARVLYSGSGGSAVQDSSTEYDPGFVDDVGLEADLRLNRTGGVVGLALKMTVVQSFLFGANFASDPETVIASTSVNIMGTSVPYYLKFQDGADQCDIVGPITFNATVTPTFAAA